MHAHRHNNTRLLEISSSSLGDSLEHSFGDLDFSVIRSVMYSYTKIAHKQFFMIPEFAFLFSWFASNPTAISQTRKNIEKKGELYCGRIFRDIEDMK